MEKGMVARENGTSLIRPLILPTVAYQIPLSPCWTISQSTLTESVGHAGHSLSGVGWMRDHRKGRWIVDYMVEGLSCRYQIYSRGQCKVLVQCSVQGGFCGRMASMHVSIYCLLTLTDCLWIPPIT